MSHKLVYGADELHFLKALALVLRFSKGLITTSANEVVNILISHGRSPILWCFFERSEV